MSVYYSYLPKGNIKSTNKHIVLDLIRFTSGGISRAELARQIGLSRAAVTTIVNDLIASGIIRETARRAGTNGRPRTLLEITPEAGYVAGVDMGASHLRIVIANFGSHVLEEKEIPINIADGPEICIAEADELLRSLLTLAGFEMKTLSAIGFSVPGPISSGAGMVIAPPIMPGWDRFPIRDTLENLWGLPVSVNNDAELGALGEWAYGAGRDAQDLAYIKVGTGIGAGLLIDGRIYRGSTGSAGEIGHLTVNTDGPLCSCGNRGCLEALSGGHAIARQAREAVENNEYTHLTTLPLAEISAKSVAKAAQRGDLVSQKIMTKAGENLGVALAGLVNIFNPDMIVVGGGVSQIGDLFLEPIRKTIARRSLSAATTNVRITAALLKKRSSSMGAVVQALSIALHAIAEGKRKKK